MKKKLLTLFLCAVLMVSAGFPVGYAMQTDESAGETEVSQSAPAVSGSSSESESSSYAILEMTVEEQYAYLLSLEDDTLAQEEFSKLDAQQQDVLIAYAQEQQMASPPDEEEEAISSAVNFDKVAYLEDATRFAAPLMKMQRAAVLSKARSDSANGLELTKRAADAGNGQYRLTLEAYTTGTITGGEVEPCDIILVLDQSTSMEDSFSGSYYKYDPVYSLWRNRTYYVSNGRGGYEPVSWCGTCEAWTDGCINFFGHRPGNAYTPKTSSDDETRGSVQFYTRERMSGLTRLEALQQAASAFVDQVAAQEGDHRIALVGFEDDANYLTGRGESAFWSASARSSDLKSRIGALGDNLDYATEHGEGLEAAAGLFEANTQTQRRRIVVLFTDGEPEPMSSSNWSARIVKQAVEQSYLLKNSYNAAVYTVSVFPGANPNGTSAMDRYMNYVSSNYPSARYTSDNVSGNNANTIVNRITPGTPVDAEDGSFYLTAGDIETLNSIFQQIADQTGGAAVSLGKNAVIKDVLSDSFTLPKGADASSITVTTQDAVFDADGKLSWTASTMAETPRATVSGNEIQVTGFDFDRNFVAERGRVEGDVTQSGSFHGRKVVISFLVEPKEGFWGGNDVPTNGTDSGVYSEGSSEPVGLFEVPTVNVPLDLPELSGKDQDIYLMADTDGLTAGKFADWTVPSGDDAWKCAYVDSNGPVFTDPDQQISNTQDTQLSVSVTVSPKTDGVNSVGTPVTADTQTADANVNVYKPVITYRDSFANTGDINYSYEESNYAGVMWKHGDTLADRSKMGAEPVLTKEYAPRPAGAITADGTVTATEDVPVTVSVKIGGTDVTQYVTFGHEACDVEDCGFQPLTEQFIVHVDTLSLTITKTVQGSADPEQTYLFHIQGVQGTAAEGISLTVAVKGSGSVTVQGLPRGSYTVTEDTSWSWRFEPEDGAVRQVEVTSGGDNSVEFVNNKTDDHWLTDEAWAENLFTGEKQKA